ncbi:MAG: hypothetical protein WCD79_12130 [Chthoniobacteraceae bacterium]
MNSESNSSSGKSFLPIVLISVSVIIFFGWQWTLISTQRDNLNTTKTKLDEFVTNNIPKLDDQVAKARQVQSGLEKLVLDLLEVAKTDADAKAIVAKYNIQQQAPPAGSTASPSPAAKP